MPVTPGQSLGSYQIVAPLGAGGMGEVYRARDVRLGRDVAIKVLPPEICTDVGRRSRFEREARVVSTLSHPNIVTIYELGEADGSSYMVMELIDGRNLRELLAAGTMPLRKSLGIAAQVADGLAKAHAAGIVHRDLKPENVMVTRDGVAKVLDFGLAKQLATLGPASPDGDTLGRGLLGTQPGTVMGTVGYMSPEQASGSGEVDFRADQFALGTLLYEMTTGKRAFQRKTAVETLTAILREEPEPIGALSPATPVPVRWIVERCLAKDPEDRYASTRDLVRDLQTVRDRSSLTDASGVGLQPPGASRRSLGLAGLAALLGLLAGALLGRGLAPKPLAEVPVTRALTYSGHDSAPAASPDGKTVAFSSDRDGRPRIWLKDLVGGGEVALTSGPDDSPRFSPDGSTLLFARAEGERRSLYRVAILGGEPRKLVEDAVQGDWSPDGKQVAYLRATTGERVTSALWVVSADGRGEGREVAQIDRQLVHPRWSPDGKTIAASELALQSGSPSSVWLLPVAGGAPRSLPAPATAGTFSAVAWLGDGEALLYLHSGVGTGSAAQLVRQELRSGATRALLWSPSSGTAVDVLGDGRVVFDARAQRQNLMEVPLGARDAGVAHHWLTRGSSSDRQPAYSADGEWLVFCSNRSGNLDLWSLQPRTGVVRRVTDDAAEDWDPAFAAGGRRILWSSNRSGHFEVWSADTDGSGARQVTRDGVDAENPTATPDGKWIVYTSGNPEKAGIWKVREDGAEAAQLVKGPALIPEVSPDGRHALYMSDWRTSHPSVRVVRVADGARVPFEIRIDNPKSAAPLGVLVGRSRWLPDGRGIAFVGPVDGGVGILAQDFVPGQDTTASRRPLARVDSSTAAESFGIAPDGSRLTVAVWEPLSSVVSVDGLLGIRPPRPPR